METIAMRRLSLLAALAAALAITGCGAASSHGADDSQPPRPLNAQQVNVTARDTMRFEPASIMTRAGEPVHLTLVNAGTIPHNLVLSKGVSRRVKIEAAPEKSASATFTNDRPETYTFTCSVPGHEVAGMKGTITAQ